VTSPVAAEKPTERRSDIYFQMLLHTKGTCKKMHNFLSH